MLDSKIRIAVISDLHCRHSGGKKPTEVNTYLVSDIFPTPINRNPVESLKSLIGKKQMTADLLLCPGDIADRSDAQGLLSGWKFLEELRQEFSAQKLIATVGNHDVDSHKKVIPEKHAFDNIKKLKNFPTSDKAINNSYWANNYCIQIEQNILVLVINTSATHTDLESAKKSNINPDTIEMIRTEIEDLEQQHQNLCKIALLHHHPLQHSNMDYRDGDFVDNSDELLKVLDDLQFTLCVHGHKHDPRLVYKNSLPVLGAGSFSSTMNLLDIKADNVFHYITIEPNLKNGTVESWIFSPKDGWKQQKDTYFPCLTGFGFRTDIEIYAQKMSEWITGEEKDVISFKTLLVHFPDIKFFVPDDQRKLNKVLLDKYRIAMSPDLPNLPEMVSKLYL